MGCKFYTVFTYVRVMSEWMKGLFFISSCGTPYWMSCWASLKVSWLVKWINYDQVRVMGLLLNSGQLRKRGRPGLQWYHFSGLIVENSLQGWVKLCSCHAPRSKKTTSWIKWQVIITDEVSLGVGVLRECIVRHLFTGMGPAGSGSPAATWLVEDCGQWRIVARTGEFRCLQRGVVCLFSLTSSLFYLPALWDCFLKRHRRRSTVG